VTNDGWYGDSAGPYQHFDMVRMRAIEQGLPLVRVANNGISALVDPYGRVAANLPLNQRGMIDVHLPKPLPTTFYEKYLN
jgi:apolipoprotein N-acyltransferase